MNDTQLRKRLIRLAHTNPELRPHLMPLLKEATIPSDAVSDFRKILGEEIRGMSYMDLEEAHNHVNRQNYLDRQSASSVNQNSTTAINLYLTMAARSVALGVKGIYKDFK